jgi:pimeloyl-ACP methyl ester carboxylesterase
MTGRRSAVPLAYHEVGSGPVLLLVMGLGADRSAWAPHVERWSARFRCIVVDNRGAGLSPAPAGPYSTAELADDYAALAANLGLGPVDVVGISMGGAIAQELALRHPKLVRRLVLAASWARVGPYTRAVLHSLVATRRYLPDDEFVGVLQTTIWTPRWVDDHAADLARDRSSPLAVEPMAFAAQASACAAHDVLDRLGEISAPALVTAGAQDRFVPLTLSLELAAGLTCSRLEVFEDTGHVHHFEEVDRFNALVEEWLA